MPQDEVRSYTRELHIDAHRINDRQIERLVGIGFFDDYFTRASGRLEQPAHHFTWQTEGTNAGTAERRRVVFGEAVKILTEIPGFSGYIESEVIPSHFQVVFCTRTFSPSARIPLGSLDLIRTSENKVADLHIKVPLTLADRHLEEEFARVGCYFVETPKGNRIYTIQFLSHQQGRAAFGLLKEFFSEAGGVIELTYEVCDAFIRVPRGLQAPAVVQRRARPGGRIARIS